MLRIQLLRFPVNIRFVISFVAPEDRASQFAYFFFDFLTFLGCEVLVWLLFLVTLEPFDLRGMIGVVETEKDHFEFCAENLF